MNSQVSPDPGVNSQGSTPGFTPRPKQDPPGMSALFVAVTIVCALGASAILTTAGRGGLGVEELTGAASSLMSSIGFATARARQPDATSVAGAESDIDFLATVVRDTATSTNRDLARVYTEMTSLKSEVSTLRERSDSATKAVSALRANVGVLQTSMDDISVMGDSVTDSINRRLAKIEDVISIRADVTASIPRQSFPPLPQPRKRGLRAGLWTAQETSPGLFLVKGPSGTFEATIGSTIPGLGRIEAVRHQDNRSYLVTGKDRTVGISTH
jgi:hypothetical protein